MARTIVIEPPAPFVTVEEAARRLRGIDPSEQDDVASMIRAACEHVDGPEAWLGRAVGVQTLETRFDDFGGTGAGGLALVRPVIEILGVRYVDPAGDIRTLSDDAYELIGSELVAAFAQAWPIPQPRREAVRVRYRAGSAIVPEPIRTAVLLIVGDLYANRESGAQVGDAAERLLTPYRTMGL